MLRLLANSLKITCAALALMLALPLHAESQKALPPAVGATREQLVARFGQPKSQLKAGSREVLFFSHWKLTLRNGVLIEVEEVTDEVAPQRAVTDASATTAPSAAPAKADQPPPPAPEASAPSAGKPNAATAGQGKAATEAEAPLEIKSVRRPSSPAAKDLRPVSPTPVPAPAIAPAARTAAAPTTSPAVAPSAPVTEVKSPPPAATAAPATTPAVAPPTNSSTASTPPVPPAPAATPPVPVAPTATAATESAPTPAEMPAAEAKTADEQPEAALPPPTPKTRPSMKLMFRRHSGDPGDPDYSVISTQTCVLAGVVVACVVYLLWRRQQKVVELAATTVSSTPLEAPAVDSGVVFTVELLSRLDALRFERLVAAYYTKTGVVAESTHAGAEAAVHIKIYWKGEPKPFAGVQCHARPTGLIEAKPLRDLAAALAVAGIRRGYVVTPGKFTVEARDLAEEQHFTLLPGELFLEKLNALPPAARADLLKETTVEPSVPTGDRTLG